MLLIYMMSFAGLMLASYHPSFHRYYLVSKSFTSCLFVLNVILNMKELNMVWFLAFVGCFLGDVFLGMDEKKDEKKHFVLGLSFFVLGHIFFVISMSMMTGFEIFDLMIPVIMLFVTAFLIRLPKFNVQGQSFPILVYSVIVSLLVIKGFDMMVLNSQYWSLFVATALFFISDFILLFLYFYEQSIRSLKFLNLFTYYTAMFLLSRVFLN